MSIPKNATLSPTPFKISIPQSDFDDFKALLRLSKLPPPTYEGSLDKFGIINKWMTETKAYWENTFDWRKHEDEINKFPQYTVPVNDSFGTTHTIHFIGVFSSNPDAVPLLLLHGWPGSFVEFLDLITLLSASSSPAFHIIVPSLPGYAFSSTPPLDRDFTMMDAAYLMNALMVGLGFGEANGGYIAQGGDIGSFVSQRVQMAFNDCKAIHINMMLSRPHPTEELDEKDLIGLQRSQDFQSRGRAYAEEHATRPSTIGHVIASNPLALLAWVGEKLFEWTDEDPPLEKILQLITLWWFTETFPRAIYPYREVLDPKAEEIMWKKPLGYSLFPKEIIPTPEKWARIEAREKLIWFKRHVRGGHFAAMEVPELLSEDLKAFVAVIQKGDKAAL